MGLGYGGFGEWGISFVLCSPLAPPGRGVGGEGVLAQRRVAPCNEGLRNAHVGKVSVSPHPLPLSQREREERPTRDEAGEGAFPLTTPYKTGSSSARPVSHQGLRPQSRL
jgi:hypothetical protein